MKDETSLLAILAATIILVLYFGLDSRVTLYVIFVSLVLTAYVVIVGSKMAGFKKMLLAKKKKNLTPQEQKLVIYYVISTLENKKFLNVEDLSLDVGLDIPQMTYILKLLEKDKVIRFMYPPLQKMPVVMLDDTDKAYEILKQLKDSLTNKANVDDTEFRKQTDEQILKLRDNLNNHNT